MGALLVVGCVRAPVQPLLPSAPHELWVDAFAREVMDSAKSMLLRSTTTAPKPELRTSIRLATTFATLDA